MKKTRSYWVPDYYPEFVCKCGQCRSTCCKGWDVSLSMEEYFRLVGMECSPELRGKMDGAFHIVENPTPERYAQISHNWQGDCPLRLPNGYCRLQCECGEDALSSVCRYYPRSPRTVFDSECACSNSCEGVLELLFGRKEPMTFLLQELTFDLPERDSKAPQRLIRHYHEIRRRSIGEIQNRDLPFPMRLMRLGQILRTLDQAFRTRDDAQILQSMEYCRGYVLPDPGCGDAVSALNFLMRINEVLGMNSASVCDYARQCAQRLSGDAVERPAQYARAAAEFDRLFPDWPVFFEQMLVNHMFYESFPFSDRRENLWDEFLSLCAVWAYVRFLAVCATDGHSEEAHLVDICAAAFRLIDHSAFDWNALTLWNAEFSSDRGRVGEDEARNTLIALCRM